MRKLFNVLAVIFIVISIVFAILPMGEIAYIPVGLSLIFSGWSLFISEGGAKKFPKILLIISVLLLVVAVVRAMMPDEVATDTEFDQKKIESKNEDLKDLEELEGDLQ
jgi:preprotein translocase subunit SecG